jgi:hypothetical protein
VVVPPVCLGAVIIMPKHEWCSASTGQVTWLCQRWLCSRRGFHWLSDIA